ncbi:MAG: ribbon-helix-helix domain-containing protein [Bifidobacteriaceae bacterium]|nr:ribbon-helix-helix domain-containing protein [Bifidobacteriaceae bacterium]
MVAKIDGDTRSGISEVKTFLLDMVCLVKPGYTGTVKTAISVPDDLFERFETAARRAGMSRSEFYREAAKAYADQLEGNEITAAMDAYIERTGDAGSDAEWTAASRQRLAEATADDQW